MAGKRKRGGGPGGAKQKQGAANGERRTAAIPLPQVPSDSDVELSDDDLDFLNTNAQSTSFLVNLPKGQLDKAVSQLRPSKDAGNQTANRPAGKRAATEDDASEEGVSEEDGSRNEIDSELSGGEEEAETWERRPRSLPKEEAKHRQAVLPVKSLEGQLLYGKQAQGQADEVEDEQAVPVAAAVAVAGVTIQDDLQERRQQQLQQEKAAAAAAATKAAAVARERKRSDGAQKGHVSASDGSRERVLKELAAYQSLEARREEARQQMALIARALLADPQGQLKQLKPLLALLRDSDQEVVRLAMLSLLAVFLDILPGYGIRPPTDKEMEMNVSIEVRKQREFESALLSAYQSYLKVLLEPLKRLGGSGNQADSTNARVALAAARTAVRCMARLLTVLPHFNYTSDLLQALVPCMAHKDEQIQQLAAGAIAQLLSSDIEGGVAAEAVQLVADLVLRRKCVAPPTVVTSLLGLRFSQITSASDLEEARHARKKRKKGKKDKGKDDDVDRAFQEAQAFADRAAQRANQSATIEAMFEIFFRVLKTCTASGLLSQPDAPVLPRSRFASKFPLLTPTLEGLSKYAHLLSVEYFSDIAAVLLQLLASTALPQHARLRCLLTAAEMLQGQAEALTVDRSGFYAGLYGALLHTPLQPLDEDRDGDGDEGPAQPDTLPASALAASATDDSVVLLTRVLDALLLDSRALDALRQAAFAKRMLAAAAAAADSGAAVGVLCVAQRMIRRQSRLKGMLENEAGGPMGQRIFSPDAEDPAEAGALTVPLWEVALLSQHYHPHVAQSARSIAGMGSAGQGGSQASGALPIAGTASELAALYSTAQGSFRPPPRPPPKTQRAAKRACPAAAGLRGSAEEAFLQALHELHEQDTDDQPSKHVAGAEEQVACDAAAQTAARQHYIQQRLFVTNSQLAQQQALLAQQLKLFHSHLQQ